MAIGDDFQVNAAGDIRHTSGTTTYTVLELHRWLMDLADDQQAAGNDLVDITVYTPSERATDNIITLLDHSAVGGPTFNIDDTAAQFIYDGSITQESGATRYSGLVVVGAVESGTQLQIIQNGILLSNYWGTGLNEDAAANILLRIMVKTRTNNVFIDGGRIRVQAREFGDTYAEFLATLALGNSTAAIFTSADLNNQTAAGTVGTYDQFTNTEGYQLIDIDNVGGTEPYYSKWAIGGGATPTSPDNGDLYEWTKYVGRRATAETIHGLNGELFRGITHQWVYDGETGTSPATNDEYAWGRNIAYTGESGGPFTLGEAVWFNGSSAIRGRIVGIDDNGTTGNLIVALEAGAPLDTHSIAGQESGATATVSGAPTGEATGGGRFRILAIDDQGTTGTVWTQLIVGTAPGDNFVLWEWNDVANAITVQGSVTSRTVSPTFLGSYTGSNIIGAFGIGVDTSDTVVGDVYTDLANTIHNPPNNVTFAVGGLLSGEDRVLVTNDQSGGIDFDQLLLNTTLSGATETAVVVTTTIPSDTPTPGTIRIELDTGVYRYQPYNTFGGSTFNITSADYTDPNDATAGNNVFISYIDKLAAAATESFTVVYNADRTLFVRVRDGGTAGDLIGIKTFETSGVLSGTGGGVTAIRTSDA